MMYLHILKDLKLKSLKKFGTWLHQKININPPSLKDLSITDSTILKVITDLKLAIKSVIDLKLLNKSEKELLDL